NREKIFDEIKKKYSSEDLDSHVHELKSLEAAVINNNGIDAQIEFLVKKCGLVWLISIFLEEE
ncbi:unnamed protein product, partial [marine sediment metagenome]